MKTAIKQCSIGMALALVSGLSVMASIPTNYPTGSGITIGYSGGHVTYGYNSVGDRIPDYSSAGYGGGGVTIPTPPVTTTLSPSGGDDTTALQNAINNIEAMSVGTNGFRGVLKLNAGVFNIHTNLLITASGVVIRGSGSGTSGTILRRTQDNGDAITIENDGSLRSQVGSTYTITTSYVPVGATYFALNSVSGLSVGDTIFISRNPTKAWIEQLPESQTNRSYGVSWDRTITEIDGNRIRIDAPVMQAIESQWGGGTLYKYTWTSRLTNSGVEDIRADAPGDNTDSLGNTDGNFVTFTHCLNCWVRRCYNDKMRGHTVKFDGSKWCTAEDINSYHNGTGSSHSGASIQIFTGSYADSILFHHITASEGGFEFTAGSQEAGPVVYTESEVPLGFAASGPHQQGNVGMVWDDCGFTNQGVSVQYQSHGWNGFDLLAYNSDTDQAFNFERPNTVHQWLFGCTGSWNHAGNGNDPEVTSFGTHLNPESLYRAQLVDRVGATQADDVLGSAVRGDTDNGTGGGGGGGSGTTYQAEDYTSESGCSFSSGIAGYTGTGFMDYGGNGTYVEWDNVNVNSAGTYNLVFRYGNGSSGDRQCAIVVNGNTVGNLAFSTTGSWSTWGTTSDFPVTLNAGNNTIQVLANTSSGGPNLDKMDVNGSGGGGGSTNVYEAETLAISDSSGDQVTTNSDGNASNGQYIQYYSNATNDYVQFTVPNVSPGTYTLSIGLKKYTNRGIVQVQVNKAGSTPGDIGSPIDLYGASSFTEIPVGTWTIGSQSDKWVKFLVVGKNAGSGGYNIAIDYIKLTLQ